MANRVRRSQPALRALALLGCILVASEPGSAWAQTSVGPRQSSPIALTNNNARLVNVNPDNNTISVFDATSDTLPLIGTVAVGGEPNSVAVHPNNTTAYVANSLDGTVSVVNLATLSVTQTIPVGAEPLGVALSPNGTRLYVANSASNNVQVIDTSTNAVVATIDLSAVGTAPRAIAVTNNGDANDTDETVFVAMFFSQLRPGKTATDEGQDDNREGHVVAISAATNTVLGTAVLAPMAKTFNGNLGTGFNSNGQLAPGGPPTGNPPNPTPAVALLNPQAFTTPTGAFPNQLAAIALQPGTTRAYVVSTGASPNGPLRFNQMAQGLVSVFDTGTRAEITAGQSGASVRQTAPLNLNQGVNLGTTPAPRLFLTNAVAMTWRPDGSDAWVVIQNTDVVVRLTVDANGIPTVNNPLVAGPSNLVRVDLQGVAAGQIAGKAPRGIAINSTGTRAYVSSFVSRSVTAIDITNPTSPAIVGTAASAAQPQAGSQDAVAQQGAELFFTGRGPQTRMSSEGWGGCIVCHPQGRADGITWMFDAGPRQTIPLDGMFNRKNPADQRILNWSAVRDENHDFELNTRGVFGGRGLIDDDRLFLAFAGANGTGPRDFPLIEQFQQFTGALTRTNDLSQPLGSPATLPFLTPQRRDFAIATIPDGRDDRIFLIGGRSGTGQGSLVTSGAVLEFNPRTNTVRTRSTTGFTPRHSLGAAAVRTIGGGGFRIYAIGGYTDTAAATNPTSLVQEYNPATDTWRTVASLPTPVAQFGITAAGGINTAEPLQLIHVVSGNGGSEAAPSVVGGGSIVQRFQPDPTGPGTWSAFSVAGLTPRRNHGAATALRGVQSRVFIIGGQDAGGTILTTVEEYLAQAITVPAGNPPHTNLPAPRARFGIGSTLTTNQIYVVGGVDSTGADQGTVFEYTIANQGPTAGPAGNPSGTWVNRGSLSTPRRGLQVSTPPGVTNFLPSPNRNRDPRQDSIAVWIQRKVRSARAPIELLDPAAVSRGRTLFGQVGLVVSGVSCATCHGGQKWTRSTVDYPTPPSPEVGLGLGNQRVIGAELRQTATQPNLFPNVTLGPGQFPGVLVNVGTFTPNAAGGRVNELRVNPADPGQAIAPLGANGFNIPSLLSASETAPYFYSGLATTLANVLDGSQDGNGGTRVHFITDPAMRADLIQFLRSIDDRTPIFP
jgi:YVTN family beta-propeller protein